MNIAQLYIQCLKNIVLPSKGEGHKKRQEPRASEAAPPKQKIHFRSQKNKFDKMKKSALAAKQIMPNQSSNSRNKIGLLP